MFTCFNNLRGKKNFIYFFKRIKEREMRISLNTFSYIPSMRGSQESKSDREIRVLLQPFTENKKAKIPPLNLMKGINPNNNNVFDTFTKIDNVTRQINFVRNQDEWNNTLMEEIEEFNVARSEYETDPTQRNYDHMEEEMGDIFYTAASIAKDSGIDPMEAFKATNRKFYNRINLMERMCAAPEARTPDTLQECKDYQRRALWNAAKRKLYDAQSIQYQA